MSMSKEQLIEAIRNASVNGRLTCAAAHTLAETLGVPLRDIGAVCNELKVKITSCQLGCF
jgi:hypothetical protein